MCANARREGGQQRVLMGRARRKPCMAAVLAAALLVLTLLSHRSDALLAPRMQPARRMPTCHGLTHQRTLLRATTMVSSSGEVVADTPPPPAANHTSIFGRVVHAVSAPVRQARRLQGFFATQLPMLAYLWPRNDPRLRAFLALSMAFMVLGKWVNVKVPFILQRAIDTVFRAATAPGGGGGAVVTSGVFQGLPASFVPAAAAIAFYGVSRALSVIFSEAKTCLFTHVSQNVLRRFASNIFSHLHSLDSEFHLDTPSGVISVAYVRAIRGFQTMLFQLVFSVAPTLLELGLVSHVLYRRCGPVFAAITLATFSVYLAYTVWITQQRISIRKELVEVDNTRNGFFIDSILNHEVVKLFTNERSEAARYDTYLVRIQDLSIATTYAIALLNLGQAAIFCVGLTSSLLLSLHRVAAGAMSVGDLVAVNSMLLQLSIPFNFIGYTYQELLQSFVDMGYMRHVLQHVAPRIHNDPDAPDIEVAAPRAGPSTLEFRNVTFHYGKGDAKEELLKGVSLKIYPGQNVAIVGPSGSGKSTTLKLITRILDPHGGQVLLDGVDVASVSLDSLRRRVAVVPQDTSLFDASVEYNLRYGNASATDDDLRRAVERCNLNETLAKLKDGIHTSVGERGARLSGGERQKVSIARALLKDPTLILCDEVTSSVDAFAERDIVDTLRQASEQRTTLTVAHRLSSVTHCDLIVVMDRGRVVEQGTHAELLRRPGGLYVQMWQAQNGEAEAAALAAARLGNCDLADDDDDIGTSSGGGGGSGDGGSGSTVGGSSMGELLGSAGGLNVGLPGGALGRGVGGSSIRSVSTTSFAATFSAPAPAAPPAGSVSEAVASVRRRRVELARGQASATAEEIVDRVLLGSHGSHGSLGGHGQGAGLLHMSGPGGGGFTGSFDSRGGGSNSSRTV